jgi:TIGR00252 family protein
MQTARQVLGERGERIAERWLEERGWKILDRRFRSGHRDLDLVIGRNGAEGRLVAFVEVKTRVSHGFGGPLAAVHWRKQREMVRAARDWLGKSGVGFDTYRFDVVGVIYGPGMPELVHIENAFQVR